MSEIEQAEQKLEQTKTALNALTQEQERLPAQIAYAAQAGDLPKLTRFQQRQAELKPEIIIANVTNRKAEIAVFEVKQAEALEWSRQAALRPRELLPKLMLENESLQQGLFRRMGDPARQLANAAGDRQPRPSAELGSGRGAEIEAPRFRRADPDAWRRGRDQRHRSDLPLRRFLYGDQWRDLCRRAGQGFQCGDE